MWPRVATDRIRTSESLMWAAIRIRSPSSAPPLYGDDGSTASTATRIPRARYEPTSAPTVVDFPAPGGPVTPMILGGADSPRASRTSLRRALSTRLNSRPAARVDPLRAASMSSSMVIAVSLGSWNLDDGGRSHAAARAHRRHPAATAAPAQFVYE